MSKFCIFVVLLCLGLFCEGNLTFANSSSVSNPSTTAAGVITRELIAQQPHLRMWEGKFLLANEGHHFVMNGVSVAVSAQGIWLPVILASYHRGPGPAIAWILDDHPYTLDMRLASIPPAKNPNSRINLQAVFPFLNQNASQARLTMKLNASHAGTSRNTKDATIDFVLGVHDDSLMVNLNEDLPIYFRLSGAWAKHTLPLRIHGSSVLRVQMMSGSSSLGFLCPAQAANGWRGFMLDLRDEVRDDLRKRELIAIDRCSKDSAKKIEEGSSFELFTSLIDCQNSSVKTQ